MHIAEEPAYVERVKALDVFVLTLLGVTLSCGGSGENGKVDAAPAVIDAAPAVVDAAPAVVDAAPAVVDAAPAEIDAMPCSSCSQRIGEAPLDPLCADSALLFDALIDCICGTGGACVEICGAMFCMGLPVDGCDTCIMDTVAGCGIEYQTCLSDLP